MQRLDQDGQLITFHDNFHCEAWIGDSWRVVDATYVLQHDHDWLLRCIGCHGVVHPEGEGGHMLDRFEHSKPSHAWCPLSTYRQRPHSRSPRPVTPPASRSGPEARENLTDEEITLIVGSVAVAYKERLALARIGQGAYRKALLDSWQTCSVTGRGPDTVLIASHIVPWCKCATNAERVDPANGLLLSPNLDKLFDHGLITFSQAGKIRISRSLSTKDGKALGVHPALTLRHVPNEVKPFLDRHVTEGHFKP